MKKDSLRRLFQFLAFLSLSKMLISIWSYDGMQYWPQPTARWKGL